MLITISRKDLAFIARIVRDKGDENPTHGDNTVEDIVRAQNIAEGLVTALEHDIDLEIEKPS